MDEGSTYRWEPPPKYRYNYASLTRTQKVKRQPADVRFRMISNQLIVPIELIPKQLKASVRMKILYGKKVLKPLYEELKVHNIKRGIHRVYMALMNTTRLTSEKIEIIKKISAKSKKHKAFLIVNKRDARSNYQADPSLFSEIEHYLGKHSRCQVFSWYSEPSPQQLQVMMGLMIGEVEDDRLIVPKPNN